MGEEKTITQDEFLIDSKSFFEEHKKQWADVLKSRERVIKIDFFELAEHSPHIADSFIERPEETIQMLETSLEDIDWAPEKCRVRLVTVPKTQEMLIRNIRSKHLGLLMSVEGIVRKASEVRPRVTKAKFECPSCGTIISVLQLDKKFKEPTRCSCGRRGSFKLINKDMVDAQVLQIEEASDALDGGEQPKKMTILLNEDLVDPLMETRTTPGSRVKIIGFLKEIPINTGNGAMLTRFDLAIDANNVIPMDETHKDIMVTEEEEEEIKTLARKGNVLNLISQSIAPSIEGNNEVKAVMALQMFGGVRSRKSDGTYRRGDLHFLMVADPSIGKSVMLDFVNEVSPKSRYVSGKSSSAAGLIAAVVKDEISGGWALEAGAMALANEGTICIDEFEKMSEEDRSSMHQAMEQQVATIAKAGVQANLNTKTAVLAAANPKFGRFDPAQDLAKQINMVPSLLSRFDVIYVLRDIPDGDKDKMIADRILGEFDDTGKEVIDSKLLKKYVAYAKQRFSPQLTSEANYVLRDYYIKMREINGRRADVAIAIGTRQLEGMVRIAQAHAKMRLSNEATSVDAKVAVGIMEDYLKKMGHDENGNYDVDKLSGRSNSKRMFIRSVVAVCKTLSKKNEGKVYIDEIKAELKDHDPSDIDDAIFELKKAGDLLTPTRGIVKLL